MSAEQVSLFMLKGMIAEASEEHRTKIAECQAKLAAVVAEYGDEGKVALTMATLEFATAQK